MSEREDLPAAIAVWWSSRDVSVLCPCCEHVHNHGIDISHSYSAGTRLSHCYPPILGYSTRYRIIFPTSHEPEVKGLSFEVDRKNGRLKTVGLDLGEANNEDEADELAKDLQAGLNPDQQNTKETY